MPAVLEEMEFKMTNNLQAAIEEASTCPFCGGKPTRGMTPKTGCQLHGDPIQYVTVSCKNNGCPATPGVKGRKCRYSGADEPKYHKEATASAIEVWNTRSNQTEVEALRAAVRDFSTAKVDGDAINTYGRLAGVMAKHAATIAAAKEE